jgi:hypothetical protein
MDDARPQGDQHDHRTTGHEANNLRVRGLLVFAAALVGVTVLVSLVLTLVMREFSNEERQLDRLEVPRFAGDTREFPAPRIGADPTEELTRMKREDLGRLADYGWIDRAAGIAHIPIDRAIDILAERGLPAARGDAPAAESRDASKTSSGGAERAKPGRPGEQKP